MGTLSVYIWIAVATFAVLAQPAVAQGTPIVYPARILERDGSQTCSPEDQVRNAIKAESLRLLQIQLPTEYSCGGSTGWRRVAYLNMSDPSQQCPSVWRQYTTPHRVCGRRSTAFSPGSCEGLNYATGSEQYNQVCGRIIGYQIGITSAFYPYNSARSINNYYFEGVSVMHGSPRQHIWSFANGLDELGSYPAERCPCVTGSSNGNFIPSFVGQNYFCETGLTRWPGTPGVFYSDGDPLWDGQGCGPTSSCCTFNSPPWFNLQLPSPTTDDIEVRICSNHGTVDGDTPIQLIELFVK